MGPWPTTQATPWSTWWPTLQLAMAVERHDLAEAEPLAVGHGGLDAVLARADEAWAWAAELTRSQAG